MSVWHEVHCDTNHDGCWSHQNNHPTGWTRAYAMADARKAQWKIRRDGSAVCPACQKEPTPMTEIYEARDFALKAHGDQKYGDEPYGVHLFAVVQVARDFDCTNAQWKAAFLHDVLEDTDATWQQVSAKFGGEVTSLVLACTGVGHNRKTRNASIYRHISDYPPAAFVKLADRIANVEASLPGSHHRAMYAKEMPAFEAVIRPHVPAAMWDRLERAFA